MTNLLIIRGIPGSGKSTLAKSLLVKDASCSLVTPNYKAVQYTQHYEADMFFIDKDGNYNFDKKYIKNAHEWCYAQVLKALLEKNNVIVSNTFIKLWELDKYLQLKDIVPDLNIEIVELNSTYDSIHNVPQETIDRMKKEFQPYESK